MPVLPSVRPGKLHLPGLLLLAPGAEAEPSAAAVTRRRTEGTCDDRYRAFPVQTSVAAP